MFELILNRLRGKSILILGFGREGRSTLRFLTKFLPDAQVDVADKKVLPIQENGIWRQCMIMI